MSYNESLIIQRIMSQNPSTEKGREETDSEVLSICSRIKKIIETLTKSFQAFFSLHKEKAFTSPIHIESGQVPIAPPSSRKENSNSEISPTETTLDLNLSRSFSRIGTEENATESAPALTGFRTENNHCWTIALIQMIINTDSLLHAYLMIGNYYKNSGKNAEENELGRKILEVYDAYTQALETQTPVDKMYAKYIREFFNYFREENRPLTSNPNEALNLLLTKYNEVLSAMNPTDHFIPKFNYSCVSKSIYIPLGKLSWKHPFKMYDKLSDLNQQSDVKHESKSAHITLNFLPGNENSFLSMLESHFSIDITSDCGEKEYDISGYKIQRFKKVIEHQIIKEPPAELIISLPRLPKDEIKTKSTIDIPIEFNLPEQISPGKKATYELTSFVVHTGVSLTTEGYVTYRKIENQWFSCKDDITEPVSIDAVTEALKSSLIHHYKKQMGS
jgi:hypothetical protein